MITERHFLEIFDHFGVDTQLRKLNEECFEFIESIEEFEKFKDEFFEKDIKDRDYDKFDKLDKHVIEEFADVMNLLTQFSLAYDISSQEVESIIENKVERTLGRIEDGYYDKNN